jgi:hypothetical protein
VKGFSAEKQAEMIASSYTLKYGVIKKISNVSFASGYNGISVDYEDGTNIRIAGKGRRAWVTTKPIINPWIPVRCRPRIINPSQRKKK